MPAKRVGQRKSVRRHYLFEGRPRGVFYPDLVGKVAGYPKTLEEWEIRRSRTGAALAAFRATGTPHSRVGIPDGWAGKVRRKRLDAIRAKAAAEAKELVKIMKQDGIIEGEDPRGDEAIEFAVGVIRAKDPNGKPVHTMENLLKAARLVADFCKVKPVARSSVKVDTAEDFLAALAVKLPTSK